MNNIVQPYRKFKSLEEATKALILPSDHLMEMHANVVVKNRDRKIVHETNFRCESFVGNFMKMLQSGITGSNGSESTVDVSGVSKPILGVSSYGDQYLNMSEENGSNYYDVRGPVIGTGLTSPTISDYKLEEQLVHGAWLPDADVEGITRTATANSSIDTTYISTYPWTTAQWRGYFIHFTSGALSGQEFYIYHNNTSNLTHRVSSPEYLSFALPQEADGMTFVIKTYGAFTAGSVSFTAPTLDSGTTSKMVISRTWINGTGQDFDGTTYSKISEFGLYCKCHNQDEVYYPSTVLIARDIQNPGITVLAGEEITLTYTISITS